MKRKNVKRIVVCCVGIVAAMLAAGLIYIGVLIAQAPKLSEIDASPDGYLTTILDKDEQIVNTLYVTESNRIYVELKNIPINLQEAFIAIEDARFYSHHGVDVKGVMRALYQGIKNGGVTQGASTITQQLLKNNVFTDWMEEETLGDKISRKIQEQYLAICLEKKYSKEWILENYLNTINLGGGTRGVQVAARYYFGKDVSELTLAESTLIAGITKNPTKYNPLKHPDKSLERQQLVLNAMLKQELISEEEYEAAKAENVLGNLITSSADRGVPVFSWFEDALLTQIVEDLMEKYGYDESQAWDLLYSGGLTIHSTQDSRLQDICEEQAIYSEHYTEDQQISIVMTDVSTGAVVAIVGGSDEKKESLSYNRATDAIRQPGSTIKVIGEYAAAMDTGKINLGSVLDDEPYDYSNGTALRNSYGSYKGMTTIRDAIATSSNVVALKTYQMAGEARVFRYLQKFGITTLTEEDKNEALAIGGTYNGVTNLQVTAAYNAIANSGNFVEPYFYTKVVNRNGSILLENNKSQEPVIYKETAELLTIAMQEVMKTGTGKSAAVSGLELAGKSGTTNENKDVWFVGFSGTYTCGIWGGHDDYSKQGGSGYVKKIWKDVMKAAHEGVPKKDLVDESVLVSAKICTKCGNLAVEGLCDKASQGNMTREEWFATGFEPKKNCDCHVKVNTCQTTGARAKKFCPVAGKQEIVYLKNGTTGTEDEAFVIPEIAETSCTEHTDFWDLLFGDDKEKPEYKPEMDASQEGVENPEEELQNPEEELQNPEEDQYWPEEDSNASYPDQENWWNGDWWNQFF